MLANCCNVKRFDLRFKPRELSVCSISFLRLSLIFTISEKIISIIGHWSLLITIIITTTTWNIENMAFVLNIAFLMKKLILLELYNSFEMYDFFKNNDYSSNNDHYNYFVNDNYHYI